MQQQQSCAKKFTDMAKQKAIGLTGIYRNKRAPWDRTSCEWEFVGWICCASRWNTCVNHWLWRDTCQDTAEDESVHLALPDAAKQASNSNITCSLCTFSVSPVLSNCWLGIRRSIRPVKTEWRGWMSVCSEMQLICNWHSWCHCHTHTYG